MIFPYFHRVSIIIPIDEYVSEGWLNHQPVSNVHEPINRPTGKGEALGTAQTKGIPSGVLKQAEQGTGVGKCTFLKHHPTIGDIISNRYLKVM